MGDDSKKKLLIGVGATGVLLAIGAYLWTNKTTVEPEAPPPVVAPVVEETEHHPVPEQPKATPLPELEQSDAALTEALAGVFAKKTLDDYLVADDIVRHIVVTIDNLPRKKIAERLKPIKPIAGRFTVAGPEEARVLSDDNFARYQPFVQIVNAVSMQTMADMYFKYYPLFQQAYVDLGYPDGYFNDRLVAVIDHLLATPDVAGPIKLTQPGVLYEYADQKLENLSAGQKTLIRMGKANAAVIKTKLRELRGIVASKKK